MSVTINGSSGVTTPGISNSEGYAGDGLTIAAGAPSGAVQVDTSGNVGIGTSSPTTLLELKSTTSTVGLSITADNASTSDINLGDEDDINIQRIRSDHSDNSLQFHTNNAERMRIDSSGNLLVGTTSSAGTLTTMRYSGGSGVLTLDRTSGTNGTIQAFQRNGTGVGTISVTTSATAYNTSSDYRLKENIQPMTGALAKVAALKPCTYKWKVDGSDGEGFIAHELAEVVPQCVTGEKDAVDAEGKPVYQGIDTSFLVATLTAALQELKAQVDAQAVEIAALKGQA